MASLLTEIEREVSGSEDEGLEVKRKFRIENYLDYIPALPQLLGGVYVQGRRIFRRLPMRDSHFPFLFCRNVTVKGNGTFVGGTTNGDTPRDVNRQRAYYGQGAFIECVYKPFNGSASQAQADKAGGDEEGKETSSQEEIDFAEQSWDFSYRLLPIQGKYFKLEIPIDGVVQLLFNQNLSETKTEAQIEYGLTRHRCLNLPILTMSKLVGTVNGEDFRVGALLYPPETLRFDGAGIRQKLSSNGVPYFDVQYKFAVKPIFDYCDGTLVRDWAGWNRVFVPQLDSYIRMISTTNSDRTPYAWDTDTAEQVIGSKTVYGFELLFHPAAE